MGIVPKTEREQQLEKENRELKIAIEIADGLQKRLFLQGPNYVGYDNDLRRTGEAINVVRKYL